MNVEKVEMLKTLKCGDNVWIQGTVLDAPIPAEIREEVKHGNDTVKVLEGSSAAMNVSDPSGRKPIPL